MADLGEETQKWKDRNPLMVWRKGAGLDTMQAAERLTISPERLLQLEVGNRPTDDEWKVLTPVGITRKQWTEWEVSKPHVRVVPPS